MKDKNKETSQYLSFILRHSPESIGLHLDSEGWAVIDDFLQLAAQNGRFIEKPELIDVVDTSDKKRFSISPDGLKIRALQGHSTKSVNMTFSQKIPPEHLYHGTAIKFLESIQQKGLVPGSRHYVHLSENESSAVKVGSRHGKPIVLKIKALKMYEQGYKFYLSENSVWLVDLVPAKFIE
ncbi:RNA 2'-phosphotransferase [Enterobacter chuandaensis]|uniref:Probable RNA 2'-phosphotransferase n=1 Tax=Enterobacter chuandaensis TaxID=2497875 RepID=A0AA96RTH3_9ENTR|nr:RNA 2'-phosphotransferase [Enterobacter chuandaensis]MCW4784072.1 RNA 2'-phosphotransferase [Enterobacter chuandaensis]MDA4759941.1 RNA 2'-phosphotransferase [Enterobacter chuandaensis]WNS38061.1 RNA 2'-phosphotransferase [Enterobacter chuandaensis]